MIIHWFRQDLRLADNPALLAAAERGDVLPIYILDDDNADEFAIGAASRFWLHHSLSALSDSLGGKLNVYRGNPEVIFKRLLENYPITTVCWNRCYEPWRIQRDTALKETLKQLNIAVESYNASLLWEPWTVNKADGTPYKVFTPFYRKGCLNATPPREPLAAPQGINWAKDSEAITIDALALLPTQPWDKKLLAHWTIGENGATAALNTFIQSGLNDYQTGRDFPAKQRTSRLSPHLHFGEISPHQVWHAARAQVSNDDVDMFCSELGWREFSYSQLFHHPTLPKKNLQSKFDRFPWLDNAEHLHAWQRGQTGIPMVDAGMRELWQTGTMHNRVRMIVGSFLVKNLRLHWHHGERWFWDCLVDADLASNSASWQWIAGCGADAAPYFRVFNPATQGEKFDADGHYLRQWLPELANLPNKYLFAPWTAPEAVLAEAQVVLGETYPAPIVDLKTSRQQALEAFQTLKSG